MNRKKTGRYEKDSKARMALFSSKTKPTNDFIELILDEEFAGHLIWRELDVNSIYWIFYASIINISEESCLSYDKRINQNMIVRWWKEFWEWQKPKVKTVEELKQIMKKRCEDFAKNMEDMASLRGYSKLSINQLVDKPRQVASLLVNMK